MVSEEEENKQVGSAEEKKLYFGFAVLASYFPNR